MKFNSRRANFEELPGLTGTARVARRAAHVANDVRRGDIVVIDHHDLDRDNAQRLIEAGVQAVVNAAPMISGRYANLGPEVLAEAGVTLVDGIGAHGWAAVPDGKPVRVFEGVVFAGAKAVARGRVVEITDLRAEMDQARSGLAAQLDTLTHNTSDFVRREQDLLLDGRGLPPLQTSMQGRPALVVASVDHTSLANLRRFVRERDPAIVAVGQAADDLIGFGWVADVVVAAAGDPESIPSADALRAARDVVLISRPGAAAAEFEAALAIERLGITPAIVETTATPEDIALLVAEHHDAFPLIGVALTARLEDFLERRSGGLASTFATRLKVGSRLIDASTVPRLHTNGTSTAAVVGLLGTGLIAVGAAIAATPAGNEWFTALLDQLGSLL